MKKKKYLFLGVLIFLLVVIVPEFNASTSSSEQEVKITKKPDNPGKGQPLKNSKIAYLRDGQLWVMDGDGSGHTQLTFGPDEVRSPSWKPDGTKIAFMRYPEGEIYSIKTNGKFETNLTNDPAGDSDPKWSPDGTKILFRRDDGTGRYSIWVMNADGSDQTQLTFPTHSDELAAWSPDGSLIAFVREGRLWLMNGNGSWQQLHYESDIPPPWETVYGTPKWSPDGTRIAIARSIAIDPGGNPPIFSGDIVVVNVDLLNVNPITVAWLGIDHHNSFNWSPDGRQIVYTYVEVDNENIDISSQIHILNDIDVPFDSTQLTNPVLNPFNGNPDWSPDGSKIVFQSSVDNWSWDLFWLNTDGSGRTNLTMTFLPDERYPLWNKGRK